MSAPNSRHGPPSTPHHERSKSQSTSNTSKPGIRLVPYTPPKIDADERAPSQASARENASSRLSNRSSGDQTIRLVGHSRSRSSPIAEVISNFDAGNVGSALSSSTGAGLPLARGRSDRVSGMKPMVSPSGAGQGGPTASAVKSPSEDSPNFTTYPASTRSSRASESPSPADSSHTATRSRSRSSSGAPARRRTIIVTNPDKTFTLVRNDSDAESSVTPSHPVRDSLVSPSLSYASRSSTQERPSILSWAESRSETPMTGVSTVIPDNTPEPPSPAPSSTGSSTIHLVEDPNPAASSSSPWSYRMVGGLRKVAQTPEPPATKEPQYEPESLPSDRPLSPLIEDPTGKEEEVTPTKTVAPKASFASAVSDQTIDTVSVSTNYKVYGPGSSPAQESNDSLLFNRPGTSNWEVLGEASPAPASKGSPLASSAASSSAGENDNYVVYGESSPSPASSLITVAKKPRPSYSQESLRVAPLRSAKKSYENFGYYKQRSRENLRSRTNSVHSLKSVPSIIGKQDPSLLVAPVAVNLGLLSPRAARGGDPGSSSQLPSWLAPPTAGSSSRPEKSNTQHASVPMITATPHQWSSQLSTVQSESEVESSPMPTRSVSPLSESSGGHHRRRSSAGWVSSMHSRQMHSVSSSIAGQLEEAADTTSGSDSLHRPQPSLSRVGQIRMVRDQDEHGDGIADLEHRPSRTGLSSYFTNTNSSSRGLHSSGSSRSRGNSFSSQVPAWAKVYYGSGERRWLGRSPSFMSMSESGSRPSSPRFYNDGDSPTDDQFPPNIYSPRKRAREVQGEHTFLGQSEMGITPAPPQDYNVFRTLRQKTSSIWSPHLRQDRRASRYSMWDPPSVNWSADTKLMGKRNIQVVLFIIGFVFPFAWMIAAVLPLPKRYTLEKESAQKQPEYSYQPQAADERRCETVRWWRNLNRIMSVVGLLIIGAVVALAVVGVKQGWGQKSR
ncbi:hypothetical protein QBC40DRAFT_87132 [Triangularia verruculosa]|uniref:Serine-rich protein n=1 Tax=Triangularia verruculosa TaxID=2587418 RepID=A0AAN6XEA2_9PEZI|nr:hypothetical protein QBC40DRAFT_87132 [Triangularia verruculosa]